MRTLENTDQKSLLGSKSSRILSVHISRRLCI